MYLYVKIDGKLQQYKTNAVEHYRGLMALVQFLDDSGYTFPDRRGAVLALIK